MDINETIKSRRSVREFKDKKPDWKDIMECIDSIKYTPMAGDNFTLKLILVDDKNKINKLAQAAQQDFVAKAKYVLVVCSDPTRTVNSYGDRGYTYCRQQAGAAIQNFLLKIVETGLATCWVGYFIEEQVKRELRIPDKINVEAILPIGYELKKPVTRRVKANLDNELYFNVYKNKKMNKVPKTLS